MELVRDFLLVVGGAFLPKLADILFTRFSKTKKERDDEHKSLDAETELTIAKTAQAISDGSTVAIENLLRTVKYMEQEAAQLKEKRIEREKEIHTERLALHIEIRDMKTKIEKDALETAALRQDVSALRSENHAAKNVIKKLLQHMVDKEMEVPDLNGDLEKLGDSIYKLKMNAAEKARLKAEGKQ